MNAFDTYRTLAFLAAVTGNIGVNGGGCNFMQTPGLGAKPPCTQEQSAQERYSFASGT